MITINVFHSHKLTKNDKKNTKKTKYKILKQVITNWQITMAFLVAVGIDLYLFDTKD